MSYLVGKARASVWNTFSLVARGTRREESRWVDKERVWGSLMPGVWRVKSWEIVGHQSWRSGRFIIQFKRHLPISQSSKHHPCIKDISWGNLIYIPQSERRLFECSVEADFGLPYMKNKGNPISSNEWSKLYWPAPICLLLKSWTGAFIEWISFKGVIGFGIDFKLVICIFVPLFRSYVPFHSVSLFRSKVQE